jgi:hypothetical protein
MTGAAVMFMALSWTFVLGLTCWSFARILRHRSNPSQDTGASPQRARES